MTNLREAWSFDNVVLTSSGNGSIIQLFKPCVPHCVIQESKDRQPHHGSDSGENGEQGTRVVKARVSTCMIHCFHLTEGVFDQKLQAAFGHRNLEERNQRRWNSMPLPFEKGNP